MCRSAWLSILAAALLVSGCRAQRTLTVTSEPTDALVALDDVVVGRTPLVLPFKDYGIRKLTLSREGHLSQSRRVEMKPPWYGRFPLDILTEVVFPVGWEDAHRVHLELEPGVDALPQPDVRSVLERAEVLRRAGPEGPRELPPLEMIDSRPPEPEEPGALEESGPDQARRP